MKIEEGDIVDVKWSHSRADRCKVLYAPCATGDSWHLEQPDGSILYVQLFDYMLLVEKGAKDGTDSSS